MGIADDAQVGEVLARRTWIRERRYGVRSGERKWRAIPRRRSGVLWPGIHSYDAATLIYKLDNSFIEALSKAPKLNHEKFQGTHVVCTVEVELRQTCMGARGGSKRRL